MVPSRINGHRVVNMGTYCAVFINGKEVKAHRYAMEVHLGRSLAPEEVVHHLNRDPMDNRIENLVLCANQGEHIRKYHSEQHWTPEMCARQAERMKGKQCAPTSAYQAMKTEESLKRRSEAARRGWEKRRQRQEVPS